MPVSKSGDAGLCLKYSFSSFGSTDNIRSKLVSDFLEGGKGKWPSPDIEPFLLIPAMEGTIADHKCFTLHHLGTECDKNRRGLQQCVMNPTTFKSAITSSPSSLLECKWHHSSILPL
jgi:hypothetical protein